MIRIGYIRLKDYENWIKSIGYDREWLIQATQAETYKSLVVESAKIGAFSFPLTYDAYLTVINSVEIEGFRNVVQRLSRKVPTEVVAYIGLGETYTEALRRLRSLKKRNLDFSCNCYFEETVVAHLDLDGYNELEAMRGPNYIDGLMARMIGRAKRISAKCGGLAYYAGGDNIICFLPHKRAEDFLNSIKIDGVKIGIGIAPRPRDALMLAANALDDVRLGRSSDKVAVKRQY
ncbi:MAG: GTP cyclohydrolase IIa [Candidatus Nezhaarchaeota archaeon]|nr:GTP cyclohydrolase IIa [Candidatus Nezhaarchaeota archaeon]MCX8141592.1 GTP cyclohydrolase IIa [Candidatus Nezhaarchaeota archaeon]MDW8049859.1 GTP cyclohydrolase IIa [Nitrososphaerota archaeon]